MRLRRLVIGLAVASAACDVKVSDTRIAFDLAEGRASDEWSRAYTLPEGGRIEIVNINGPIQVFPAAGPQVEVRAARHVSSRSEVAAKALLAKLEIREEVAADRVTVESADARSLRGFGDNVRVEYRVNVPPGVNVSLRTQNGGIEGRGVASALDASTVNGGITLDLAGVPGDVRLMTVNGGIRLDLPADVNAELDATTINGGVIVSERLALAATERARLHVAGRINAGGPTIEVRTTNGGVRIDVAGSAAVPATVERQRSR